MGRLIREWFIPSEDFAASERLAAAVRVILAIFVWLLNAFVSPYFGVAGQRVSYSAIALGAASVVLFLLTWLWWKRFPKGVSFLLQLGDVFFISWLLYLAPNIRASPYDILYFLIILLTALRFGLSASLVSSAVVATAYIWIVLDEPYAFSTDDLRNAALITRSVLFFGVAAMGGIMSQMVRRLRRGREEERQRTRELEVVQRVASAISATLEMDQLMERVFLSLQDIIPFTEGEITLWEGGEGCLISRSLFTPEGYIRREMRYAPGEGYSGWMVVHRQSLWIPDVSVEKEVQSKDELTFTSYVGVPLLIGDRLVGTLELSSQDKAAFSHDDRDLLVATAPQVAAMLDHARMYDQLRQGLERRVHQLSAIEQLDRELSGTLDLAKVIQSVLDHAMDFTGADVGALLVITDQRDGMQVLASRGYPEQWQDHYRRELWPLDAGITGRVVRTNRPALVEDVSLDPDYADASGKTGSELAVPISREKEVLGVLNLESPQVDAFDEEALEFVQHLAEHAAIAMYNARVFSRERQRARELAALQEVSLELSQQLSVDDILRTVVKWAVRLLNAAAGGLYLLDAEWQTLELVVVHNMDPDYVGTRLVLGEGLSGQVAQSRKPIWVDDYHDFSGRSAKYDRADFRSVIAVPLLYGDDVLGVLNVLHREEDRTFGQGDLRLLLPLANQAVVAITNARLFQETRRSAEHMSSLQEFSRALGQTLGFQETMAVLIQGLQHLIPHSGGEVCLYDPERQVLVSETLIGESGQVVSAGTYTLDEGYSGWIGQHRQPLLIEDCSDFTEVQPKSEDAISSGRVRAFLGVPMLIGDRLIGTLELVSDRPGNFDQEHLRLLTLVSRQSAVAIDNARFYELTGERLRMRIEQMVALQRIGQEMNTTLELERNLHLLLNEGIRASPATYGNVAMYDELLDAFRVSSAHIGYETAEARLLKQLRLGRGRSMMEDVLRSGQPEIVEDAQLDSRAVCVRSVVRSAISVPILYEARVVGVINLRSTEPHAFKEEDLEFVQTLATQASLAVGNSRRYNELVQQRELVGQRANQLREILDIGNTLRADLDLSDILDQVAYGVVGSVGFGMVLFSVVSERDPNVLKRVASAGIPLEDFRRMQEMRPSMQSYQDLFLNEHRISRSYFIPEEAGLSPQDGRAYVFPEMEYEQDMSSDEWHPHDMLLVPMYSSASELLGVMSLDNPFDRQRPNRRLVEALEIFANQAAIAVENSRLFRERERRIAELNALNLITRATTSSLDMDTILQSIYERLAESRVLDVENFYIGIYDADRDRLRFCPVVDRACLYDPTESEVAGMAGWVVRNRAPLLLANIDQAIESGIVESVVLAGEDGEQPQSYLGVPILVGEELIGVIAAQSYQRDTYGMREEQFLLTVANQVSVAIQNARLFREREQRLAELAILNEVGRALSSALNLEELVEVVYEQVNRIFDTTNFYIALYEEDSDEWETLLEVDKGERIPPERYKVGAGLTGYIIRHREPLLFFNADQVVSFHEEEGISVVGEPAQSWLGVPLIAADKVVGVMAVQNYDQAGLYSEQDLVLFSTIAAQTAIAMDNAHMFEERERRITELSILNEVGRAISSALTPDDLLKAVHEQVNRIFDTTNFFIALYEEGDEDWEMAFHLERGERQPLVRYPVASGLTGHMIRNRTSLLLRNLVENAAFHHSIGIDFLGEQAHSWLGVPMLAADKVVGVMAVQSYEQEGLYDEQDLALFTTVAAQAAIAVDNVHLFEQRERRITELSILNEVGRALSSALELEHVTEAIYEQVGRILDTTNFYVAIHDEESATWETVLDILNNERRPSARYSVEEGLTGYIIRHRQPLMFHDSERLLSFLDEQGAVVVGDLATSWVGVPMIAADQVVGVVGVESYELEHAFDEEDLAVLSTVAAQAAVAIQNARNFGETRRRLRQVNTLLEVSRDVAVQQLDLSSLLQSILEAAEQSVSAAERGSILLLDMEAEELAVAAMIGYPSEIDRSVRISLSDSFAGWVCREGRADIVVDAQTDPRFVTTASSREIRSMMSAPLVGRRGLVGVINLNNLSETGAFSRSDLEFLSGLAHQAAVAIENAGLFEERERQARVLEARVRELSALLEGTRAITSTMELQDVLETLVGVVGQQMDVTTVALWLIEDEVIVPQAAIGLPEDFLDQVRLSLGEGLTGQVAASGEILSLPDVAVVSEDEQGSSFPSFDRDLGLHAFLGVPIAYQERVLGVLSVMSEEVREFAPEEITLLNALSEQIGIAVENSRLFQERERRIAELGVLNEIGRAISSTMRLHELLETVRREAGRLMDTSNFLVALYDERTEMVAFPVYHEFGHRLEMDSRRAGNGLTEYVIRQRAPVLIRGDTGEFCEKHGIDHSGKAAKSWLAVPMIYMDRVIGVIALQDYERVGAYDEHHVRLLSTIVSQAAVSIQNARFFSDLETSRTELETRLIQLGALQDMGQAIAGSLELDEVLDIALEAVTATVGFSYAVISLVDEDAGEVRSIRGYGVSEEQIVDSRHPLDSSDIMADIVRTGKTEIIDGWDDRFDPEVFEAYGHADLVRVFAPLGARGKVIGLIEAGYPKAVRPAITQDDLEILQTFLAQASTAIDNARLFTEIRRFTEELEGMVETRTEQLQDEKNRLEALHTITTELASSLDLDEILLKTVDLASMATGRSLGMILLRDPASGNLVCRAMLDEDNVPRSGHQVVSMAEAGALHRVLEEQVPLCIENAEEDPLAQDLPALPVGARSVAAVPLISGDVGIGIILLSHSQVSFFDDDQMRLLMTLGAEVATAIHNAELYSYINDQALRLAEMLNSQQEEASKSAAILQSIADGVMVVDRDKQIILANPAAEEILGIPREEMEGHFTSEFPGLFMSGGVLAQEHPRFELMGCFVNVHSASVVTNMGDELGVVYVLRDITREVEADRAKSDFISTVSHELRTPLTSIKGYVDLILLGSVGEISPMQKQFLDVVRSNANRLVDLINDLLDISRIETGRMVLNPELVSMFDLIEEVVESARMELERKQLVLSMDVPPDLPMIPADRKRILQVLNNLISNAYKYTREGGQVRLVAHGTDGFLQVDVSDTGVGISEEDQKRLFSRFFRADNPLRDEVGGTGLGLAISKSFVEMHSGQMWVESELEVGSTFSFTLPLHPEEEGQEPKDEPEQEIPAGEEEPVSEPVMPDLDFDFGLDLDRVYHILIVDDDPDICDLLCFQLEQAGYKVSVARRGEQALEIARQEQPDLITLDIMMVGMDGFEVLEQLKADEQTAHIPVVIASIIAEQEDLMAMGAVDFLPKPLDEIALQETIRRVLGRSQEPRTVLVVDDDDDIVGWLGSVLEAQGFHVESAGDGEAALELVATSPPDLILLDLRMPKLDGREVIKRLKLQEETRDIPIIVITAGSVDKERDRVQMLGMGAESFLTKPFTAEQLVHEIGRALRERMEAAKE